MFCQLHYSLILGQYPVQMSIAVSRFHLPVYLSPTTTLSEKDMATHSSILAWRIPGMEEAGGLPSVWSHRVGHNRSDLAAAATTL